VAAEIGEAGVLGRRSLVVAVMTPWKEPVAAEVGEEAAVDGRYRHNFDHQYN
jgi:hypothetical protein